MKASSFATASVLALALSLVVGGTAQAQTTPPAEAPEADSGEIVVTAQKRSESLQNVPISIAAFNGATLERTNVTTVLDLGKIATNFQSVRSSNTGSTRLGIRGVGSLANTLIEPSVAVFLDGVYVPRSGSILGAFLDIDGVEVLRGPQGTLFGRNASVGALSLKSALPKQDFSGQVSGEIGSFDRYKVSGFVNVPLADNVALRVAGMGQWYKGPWVNQLDGLRYGGSNDLSGRATLKADFGGIEWVVRGDYTRLSGDGVANFDFDANSVSPARLAFIQAAFNGGPDTVLGDRNMNQFMATGLVDTNWGVSSTLTVPVGNASLKLINSYRVWKNDQLDGDIIYFPVSLASRRSLFDSKSHNHELQFISPEREWFGGAFDMVAGVYYFNEDFRLDELLNMGTNYCGVLVPAGAARTACAAYYATANGVAATNQQVFQNVSSIAAYAQGNIHLGDQLTLTLGGRYTNDRKRGTYNQASSAFTQTLRAPEVLTYPGLNESKFTYRVSLNYKPSRDVLIFANLSTGYKSGGYNSGGGTPSLSTFDANGNLVSTKRVFAPETVKNYELGIKSSWLDRTLRANLTFYRIDIDGFQDRAFDGVSFIVRNAGGLRQQGFEFDTTLSPTRNLSLTVSIAYLDSKFTSFTTASNLPGLTGTQDLTGKPNSFSPEWTGNFALDWSSELGSSGMRFAANANLSLVSDQFVGTQNDGNVQTLADGYALLGARLTLSGRDDRWSVSMFGRNLTGTSYSPLAVYQPLGAALGLNNTVFNGSTAVRIQASEPRTYGASATIRF
ncbi:TonB-dependent receptor [Sphingomonas sp. SUN039]|uniref:TonB-dependent receptor n=1 Tax=Sphingomonas sp. SUN039 TaxID=2937787 RepID=UPI0021648E25|nr:TonB-dependent receptor [Sphingomonas sp. SUN039]UVO54734.1 TonB-dependent receptor [Sphingomonas sp. SUN039]